MTDLGGRVAVVDRPVSTGRVLMAWHGSLWSTSFGSLPHVVLLSPTGPPVAESGGV